MLLVIQDPGRVLSSYSKLLETKTSIQRSFSHNKKLYASKEVKKSPLNCFRGQILSEKKTARSQSWNAQETYIITHALYQEEYKHIETVNIHVERQSIF